MTDPSRCHIGDAREVLATMVADGVTVQMCVTSPPYWGLRDYGVEGQIGLEPTPEEYVATMVEVFRLVREVLAEDGTCWVNLGDGYNANTGAGFNGNKRLDEKNRSTVMKRPPGLKPKDLVGIPWRLAFALQADGWYLRSDIIWHKPNPMPESVTDRPTKAHEYLFLLSKRERYYYDANAIREPQTGNAHSRGKGMTPKSELAECGNRSNNSFHAGTAAWHIAPDVKRNRRSVWTIPTQAYSEAHFATFPRKLVEPCVLAGTSQRGHCPECGGRWTRVVERGELMPTRAKYDKRAYGVVVASPDAGDQGRNRARDGHRANMAYEIKSLGWTPACTCGLDPVPDIVLDPFFGSGTVGQVAQNLGRHWIGIDLNPHYAAMQHKRTAQKAMVLA